MKIFFASVIALLVLLCGDAAFANPPNAMDLKYDRDRGELSVQVEHVVSDRSSHFIDRLVVQKNGAEVASKSFDSQTSNRNQTLPPIKVIAAPGDKLTVTAHCNKWGSRTATVMVE